MEQWENEQQDGRLKPNHNKNYSKYKVTTYFNY